MSSFNVQPINGDSRRQPGVRPFYVLVPQRSHDEVQQQKNSEAPRQMPASAQHHTR